MEELALDPAYRETVDQTGMSDLEKMFYNHHGRLIHKWIHYLPIYARYFEPYRERAPKMLEIGVSHGGSLELWRTYFGADATIFGIDNNPDCAARCDLPNQVRIGSQADPDFLRGVVAEMGAPDIILDDGSHIGTHQIASFKALFPLLKDGGLYIIEDLHTSYWPAGYQGGLNRRGTAIEMVKSWIDQMHDWYHDQAPAKYLRDSIAAIHIHDSIVVVEKAKVSSPRHIKLQGDVKTS
jgi:cephalosporin hydroxylase